MNILFELSRLSAKRNYFFSLIDQLQNYTTESNPPFSTLVNGFDSQLQNSLLYQQRLINFHNALTRENLSQVQFTSRLEDALKYAKNYLESVENRLFDFLHLNEFGLENGFVIDLSEENQNLVDIQYEVFGNNLQQVEVQVQEQELVQGQEQAIVNENTKFIRLHIPLDSFNFHNIFLYSFQCCKNKTSIKLQPELQVQYGGNGWFAGINCDVKFNFSNVFQQKTSNGVAICVKKGNNIGKIAYSLTNDKPEYNFSFTSHITTLQKSDVNWTLNFSAQDTNFQLQNTSFEIDASSHLGVFNEYFTAHPSISYKIYPFWNSYICSDSKNSKTQSKQLSCISENYDSTDLMSASFEYVDEYQQLYLSTIRKNIERDKPQAYILEPTVNYDYNPRVNFITNGLILVSIVGIGFLTIRFLKKIFKFKD